ncbi:hypothetical protein GTR02_01915 [Kineococcus sp. R8]|nr:hypothetical protein [Kineococcus siccus]
MERADGAAVVEQPAADPTWCRQAVALWEAMGSSGQAQYFEPSDWAEVAVAMWFLTSKVAAGRIAGQDLQALHSILSDHLVSEGARRRLRVELRRLHTTPEVAALPEGVTTLERHRSALT